MDYIKEILNVGDDVLSAVTTAIEKNDYSNLSADLKTRFRIFEEDLRADIRMRAGESLSGKTGSSGGPYGAGRGRGAGPGPGGQGPDSTWRSNSGQGPGASWNTEAGDAYGSGRSMGAGPGGQRPGSSWNTGSGSWTASGPGYNSGNGSGADMHTGPGGWSAPGAGYGQYTGQGAEFGPGSGFQSGARTGYRGQSGAGSNRGSAGSSFTRKYGTNNSSGSYTYRRNNPLDRYVRGQNKARTPFRHRFFSKAGSITKMVFGIMGMVIFLPASLGAVAMMLTGTTNGLTSFLTVLPFAVGSTWLTFSGNRRRKLINLYNRYAELIGPAEYIAIGDLADHDGNSKENVLDNIQKLMKSNMLPQGRLDRNQTTLMLTSKAWDQYQAAENSRSEREAQEQEDERAAAEMQERMKGFPVIREGNEYIQRIHQYNDQIPDPEMSEKLSRLESIMQRIFQQVEKDPDSAPDLHKLMNYYLPTTEKLILAYIDLDQHPSGIDNIDRTRSEIEDAVDTVNGAFETLFNDLFQDTAWDISSDISVMKSMMKQDGLMKEPLKAGQEQ